MVEKLKKSSVFSLDNVVFSAWEPELKEVANKHGINIFHRSKKSAFSEGNPITEIYEWHDKLPFKYVISISACNPLLDITTIDGFVENFVNSDKEGAFAVFKKKTYYWDKDKKPLTDWKGTTSLNTKIVDPVYEAAHCLYASRMNIISDGYWMDTNSPPNLELFVVDEIESFDIDNEWQFKLGEILYKNKGLLS